MPDITITISQKVARELYAFAQAPRIAQPTMSQATKDELLGVMKPVAKKGGKVKGA